MKVLRAGLALTVMFVCLSAARAPLGAQQEDLPAEQAPTVTLDRSALKPGERLIISLAGWKSQVVTISVCGNLAKRGASDCNMSASTSFGMTRGPGTALAQIVVSSPPYNCPCVIRAASSMQDEVVLAPIELIGIPVDPLVDPVSNSPAELSIDVRRNKGGLANTLRTLLGGETEYDVIISVRNTTTETLAAMRLWGSVGRNRSDELVSLPLPTTRALAPGATWTHTEHVRLPPPVFGSYIWRIGTTGGTSSDQVEQVTRLVPYGFAALGTFLVLDVVAIAWRHRSRKKKEDEEIVLSDSLDDTAGIILSIPEPASTAPAVHDDETLIDLSQSSSAHH